MNNSFHKSASFVKSPREILQTGAMSTSLREANRRRIVEELRRHGNLSRADLARLMGLSPTTITTLVADLQSRGLVVEESERSEQGVRPFSCGSTRRRAGRWESTSATVTCASPWPTSPAWCWRSG
jgi:hypothetical protein